MADRLRRAEENFTERETHLKQEIENLRSQLEKERAARALLEDELRQSKRTAEAEATARGIAEGRLASLEKELAALRSRASEDLRQAQRQTADEQAAHRATQDRSAQLERELADLKGKLSTQAGEMERQARDNSELRAEVERLKKELAAMRADNSSLGGQHRDSSAELTRYKARFFFYTAEFYTRGCHFVPPPACLKVLHACDQWHSSWVSTTSYRYHRKSCRNTEGTGRTVAG
jgi:chromosome segregation ATPase